MLLIIGQIQLLFDKDKTYNINLNKSPLQKV